MSTRTSSVTVQLPGEKELQIAYNEKGRGKPIIFLHGLGGSKREFRELIFPYVPRGYQAIAIDFPGFGDSSRLSGMYTTDKLCKVVKHTLDALGIEKAYVVGTSLGGIVALKFMARYPERVIAAAVQGAPLSSKDFPFWLQAFALHVSLTDLFSGFIWRPLLDTNKPFLMQLIVTQLSPDTRLGREKALRLINQDALDLDVRAVINLSLDITTHTNLTESVRAVTTPTLLIDGDTVKHTAIDTTKRIASLMTSASMVETRFIRDATHLAPFSHPQEFMDGVVDFFKRNPPL